MAVGFAVGFKVGLPINVPLFLLNGGGIEFQNQKNDLFFRIYESALF